MKKPALIIATLALMTAGAYAQGETSTTESNPAAKFERLHSRQKSQLEAATPSEGSGAARGMARSLYADSLVGKPAEYEIVAATEPIQFVRVNTVGEDVETGPDAARGGNADESFLTLSQAAKSTEAQVRRNDFRAWDYNLGSADEIFAGSIGGMAWLQGLAAQSEYVGASDSGAGVSGSSPQKADLEIIDDSMPHRLMVPNIASPEPDTVGLALTGGLVLFGMRFAKRRV